MSQESPVSQQTGVAASDDAGLPELDPVIHAQPRLRLTVALAALPDGDKVTFPRLQELAGMTAGNLATHLRKLEEAGYVEVTKAFRRRTPVTYLALTRAGRRALEDYTAALQGLLAVPGLNGNTAPAKTAGPRKPESETENPS